MRHGKVSSQPLLLLGNLPAHDRQQWLDLLVKLFYVALPHILELFRYFQYGLGVFTRDTLGKKPNYEFRDLAQRFIG